MLQRDSLWWAIGVIVGRQRFRALRARSVECRQHVDASIASPKSASAAAWFPSVLHDASDFTRDGGPGGLVCSNRCIRNVSAGTHNMQAVDDTSEAVDVDGGLRATADEEKKYRP